MNELIILVLVSCIFVVFYPAAYLFVRLFIEIRGDEIRFTLKKVKYIVRMSEKRKNYCGNSMKIINKRQKQTKNI